MFFGNPTGSSEVHEAMSSGEIGYIGTPAQGNRRPDGAPWIADNGCYSDRWDEGRWWAYLQRHAADAGSCLFAVAPDVVGDAAATARRSDPWLEPIRELGYPVAYVLQDGQESLPVPWDRIDAVFVGGSTEWKLGGSARALVAEAKRRGLWVHMGRVNTGRRWAYAASLGCDSVDGTCLTFHPTLKLAAIRSWIATPTPPALPGLN